MALLNKFFHSKKCGGNEVLRDVPLENDIIPFVIRSNQIRVLLFRDCERRGRELLFDSLDDKYIADQCKLHSKNMLKKNEGDGAQCKTTNPETILFGEMIFGSVAMKCKGMSFKLHLLESPQRLLCTKVYNSSPPSHSGNGSQLDDATYTNKSSPWTSFSTTSQVPLSVGNSDDHLRVNCFINKSDSGYSSHPSSLSSIDRCQSSFYELFGQCDDSYSSQLLSFGASYCNENLISSNTSQWNLKQYDNQAIVGSISKMRKDSETSRSSRDSSMCEHFDSSNKHSDSKRIRLGIAFLITLADDSECKMLTFLMDHAILIEGALTRLKQRIYQALLRPQLFTQTMSNASHQVIQWLVDLLSSPRIQLPIWSCLSSGNKNTLRRKVADIFMHDFCSLLSTTDTKDTCFFMSTLLTNILTFHLGWVNSVSPYDQQQLDPSKTSDCGSHNPLQMQLREMYGVIGIPPKVSRTIVYGKQNTFLIRKVLMVLTYFIRCVNVKRFEYTYISRESVDNILNYNVNSDIFYSVNKCTVANSIEQDIHMKMFSSYKSESDDSDEFLDKYHFYSKDSTLCVPQNLLTPCYNNDSKPLSSNVLNVTNANNPKPTSTPLYKNSLSKKYFNLNKMCDIETDIENSDTKSTTVNLFNATSVLTNLSCNQEISIPFDMQKVNGSSETHKSVNASENKNVVFILGEDEELIGLKDSDNVSDLRNTVEQTSDVSETNCNEQSEDKDNFHKNSNRIDTDVQSESCIAHTSQCKHSSFKKHSGVKFDFEKYPQIVTNYMKSKNIEFLDRHVIGKPGNLKFVECREFERESNIRDLPKECDTCQNCSFTGQGLQTPSNASELEYTSDIPSHDFQYAKEHLVPISEEKIEQEKVFVKRKLNNTLVVNNKVPDIGSPQDDCSLKTFCEDKVHDIELPLNDSSEKVEDDKSCENGFCNSLFGSVSDHYISDLVLQGGVGGTKSEWEKSLSRDLKLQPGATCLLADIDDWSVRVFGSDGGGAGDMSTLVSSMLDCIPQMCRAKVPSFQCLAYIELKLREMCIRSKSLAQLLIDKDFCDMDYLTKTLNLEPNDVPLLLAIASTHTPQAALKYGVSYR